MANGPSDPASFRFVLPLVPARARHHRVPGSVPVIAGVTAATLALAALATAVTPSAAAPVAVASYSSARPHDTAEAPEPFRQASLAEEARRAAAIRAARDAAARAVPQTRGSAPVASAPARPASPVVVLPIAGGYRLTAGFHEAGARWSGHRHTGQDFAIRRGTPVRAVAAGVVRAAGSRGSYGLRVEIRHADGTVTTYSHLSSIGVRVGQRIAAGQRVGRVGSTGNTTGAHLHLEVLAGGRFVDPLRWLRARGVRP